MPFVVRNYHDSHDIQYLGSIGKNEEPITDCLGCVNCKMCNCRPKTQDALFVFCVKEPIVIPDPRTSTFVD